jgi:hypothetical protein
MLGEMNLCIKKFLLKGDDEMKSEIRETLETSYKARMMWFAACQFRVICSDIRSLSHAGVTVRYMDNYVEDMRKHFRFSAECEYEDQIMKDLEEFGKTMISYDQMGELICNHVLFDH